MFEGLRRETSCCLGDVNSTSWKERGNTLGTHEWNGMPFRSKNAPSEFQNILNAIFNPYTKFIIVYIDDVLVFSDSIEQHWKHLIFFLR